MNYNTDPFEEELSVKDGALQTVFKVDNLKTKDLIQRGFQLSKWHDYVLRVLAKEVEEDDAFNKIGKTFLMRKIIVYGLGVFEIDNGRALTIAQKHEKAFLAAGYDAKTYARISSSKMVLAGEDIAPKRTQTFLEDKTLGRISAYAETCRLTTHTLVRLCVSYSTVALKSCFGANIIEFAEADIRELKEYLQMHTRDTKPDIETENSEFLKWLRDMGATDSNVSTVTVAVFIREIQKSTGIKKAGARKRLYNLREAGLICTKRHGQRSSRVWLK